MHWLDSASAKQNPEHTALRQLTLQYLGRVLPQGDQRGKPGSDQAGQGSAGNRDPGRESVVDKPAVVLAEQPASQRRGQEAQHGAGRTDDQRSPEHEPKQVPRAPSQGAKESDFAAS